jgi:DNA-binding response OmpR family regulator
VGEETAVELLVPATLRGAGEQILVVEDDPQVRAVCRRALQGAGYAVYEAITGLAALHFMASHSGEIDLIVSDVVMPGVNGQEMADRLRDSHSEVPILFVSGYPGTEIKRRGLDPTKATFMAKPFTPEELVAAVHDALARRPSSKPAA